jgi:hypothetical protein
VDVSKVLPYDKALHILGGFIVFAALVHFIGADYALGAAFVIGVLKEFYDTLSGRGTFDTLDAVATWAGGVLGYSCTLALGLLVI